MSLVINSILLLSLFAFLGLAGNVAVENIKYIASALKIRLFAFGILLGIITTLPELSVGLNAMIDDVPSLSAGNLLGGTLVILGLVLGSSLLLNRGISTDGQIKSLIPQAAVIFFPLLLGLDGRFSLIDGGLMLLAYLGLIYYLYRVNGSAGRPHFELIDRRMISRALLLSIVGIVAILLVSHWIVLISLNVLDHLGVSRLLMGVLIFSIGTNLPEITVTITTWRKKAPELSLSHLLSSNFTNVLVLGLLAVIRPISFNLNSVYWVLMIFSALILICFLYFYHSGKKLDRREGILLLGIYALFLIVNILIS
ncbi:MAG: hypothetical protein V1738_02150 [Patescibacteria group bacterium]